MCLLYQGKTREIGSVGRADEEIAGIFREWLLWNSESGSALGAEEERCAFQSVR